MTFTKNRHKQADLYKDVENIKSAIALAMKDSKNAANQALIDSFETVKDKSTEVKDKVADYTAEKPFKTLGMTFIFGLIIGYLIHK